LWKERIWVGYQNVVASGGAPRQGLTEHELTPRPPLPAFGGIFDLAREGVTLKGIKGISHMWSACHSRFEDWRERRMHKVKLNPGQAAGIGDYSLDKGQQVPIFGVGWN